MRTTIVETDAGERISLMLPPEWWVNTTKGAEYYLGDILGTGMRLEFGIGVEGWYNRKPEIQGNERHEPIAFWERIDSRTAKLLLAADPPDEWTLWYSGETAVYFGNLHGGAKFGIYGTALTEPQQLVALAIFRSILIEESNPSRKAEATDIPTPRSTTTPERTLANTPTGPEETATKANPLNHANTIPGEDWTRTVDNNWTDGEVFSLLLPPGWWVEIAYGIDSYVGYIHGDGISLGFEMGWYHSVPSPLSNYWRNEHMFLWEEIEGRLAMQVIAVDPPKQKGEDCCGSTVVHFEDLHQDEMFTIWGIDLTEEEQLKVLAIYRSIRIPNRNGDKTEATTPDSLSMAAARRMAISQLGLGHKQRDELLLISRKPIQWPTPALGCSKKGIDYSSESVAGHRSIFSYQHKTVTVHTGEAQATAIIPHDCLENSGRP